MKEYFTLSFPESRLVYFYMELIILTTNGPDSQFVNPVRRSGTEPYFPTKKPISKDQPIKLKILNPIILCSTISAPGILLCLDLDRT